MRVWIEYGPEGRPRYLARDREGQVTPIRRPNETKVLLDGEAMAAFEADDEEGWVLCPVLDSGERPTLANLRGEVSRVGQRTGRTEPAKQLLHGSVEIILPEQGAVEGFR